MSDYPKEITYLLEDIRSFAKRFDHSRITSLHALAYLVESGKIFPQWNPDLRRRASDILASHISNTHEEGEATDNHSSLTAILERPKRVRTVEDLQRRLLPHALRYLYDDLAEPGMIGLDPLIDKVNGLLSMPRPVSVIIHGEEGSGKSNLLKHFVRSTPLATVELDASIYLDPFMAKDKAFASLKETITSSFMPGTLLVVDDIHLLSEVYPDLYLAFLKYLHEGSHQMVATSLSDFALNRLADKPTWRRAVRFLELPLPGRKEIREVALHHADQINRLFSVEFSPAVLERALEFSRDFVPNRVAPGNLVDTILYCAACSEDAVIDLADFKTLTERSRGTRSDSHIEGLEDELRKHIFGQDDALHRLTERLKITRMEMDAHPHRPDGVFFFLGPSGVGKTETARVLAKILYGDPRALIKIDMSEFMDRYSISKLIGSPPGYIGYDEGAFLTRAMGSGSERIILLDEVEKAHPQVLNLFLQVFDEGKLTDSHGTKLHFDYSIVIMTSNIGRQLWSTDSKVGFLQQKPAVDKSAVTDHLLRLLPSEFLNRIDEIILFNALSDENLRHVVAYQLEEVARRFLSRYDIRLHYDDAFIKWLAALDYEPAFGARHVIRNIERHVVNTLLDKLAAGETTPGGTVTLHVPE